MLKVITREVERPIVIVAVDRSKSMANTKDSTAVIETVKNFLDKSNADLPAEYDLKVLSLGDKVRENNNDVFTDKATDFT